MIQIQQTEIYAKWFAGVRDRVARARIDIRIRRLSLGNAGMPSPLARVSRSGESIMGLDTGSISSSAAKS